MMACLLQLFCCREQDDFDPVPHPNPRNWPFSQNRSQAAENQRFANRQITSLPSVALFEGTGSASPASPRFRVRAIAPATDIIVVIESPEGEIGFPETLEKVSARCKKCIVQNNQFLTVPTNDFRSRENSPVISNLSLYERSIPCFSLFITDDDFDSRGNYSSQLLGQSQTQRPSAEADEFEEPPHVPIESISNNLRMR